MRLHGRSFPTFLLADSAEAKADGRFCNSLFSCYPIKTRDSDNEKGKIPKGCLHDNIIPGQVWYRVTLVPVSGTPVPYCGTELTLVVYLWR